jgi:hypothetical protein
MAADKGVDIVTTGQAVVYYETQSTDAKDDADMFDRYGSQANVGVQLNLDADLKNDFTFGSQLSYLGTAGLERNLVSGTKEGVTTDPNSAGSNTGNQLALTQINIAKKIANTTVKIGRQELPKSLSPFAFSEDWNVFKNTFDAIIAINSDIPDTTVVAAYVSGGTTTNGGNGGLNEVNSLAAVTTAGVLDVSGAAYMLTVANTSLPMTAITLSYYSVSQVEALKGFDNGNTGATAMWADVAVADKDLPLGLKVGLQGGVVGSENGAVADTTAMGAKISLAPADAVTVGLAYTSVDGDENKANIAIKNFGTGVKTPLYTQMIYNQDAIALDADTIVAQAAYNTGDYGTISLAYGMTTSGKANLQGENSDYNELDLVYKIQAAGVQYFVAYLNRSIDKDSTTGMQHGAVGSDGINAETENRVRVWARYNF